MARSGSAVVEHSTHHPKVVVLSPANVAVTEREEMGKNIQVPIAYLPVTAPAAGVKPSTLG